MPVLADPRTQNIKPKVTPALWRDPLQLFPVKAYQLAFQAFQQVGGIFF